MGTRLNSPIKKVTLGEIFLRLSVGIITLGDIIIRLSVGTIRLRASLIGMSLGEVGLVGNKRLLEMVELHIVVAV